MDVLHGCMSADSASGGLYQAYFRTSANTLSCLAMLLFLFRSLARQGPVLSWSANHRAYGSGGWGMGVTARGAPRAISQTHLASGHPYLCNTWQHGSMAAWQHAGRWSRQSSLPNPIQGGFALGSLCPLFDILIMPPHVLAGGAIPCASHG